MDVLVACLEKFLATESVSKLQWSMPRCRVSGKGIAAKLRHSCQQLLQPLIMRMTQHLPILHRKMQATAHL